MGPACRKRSHDQRDRYLSRWTPFIPRFVTSPRNQFRHFCVHLSLNIRIIFWIKLAHAFFYRSRVGLLGFAVNRVTWWSCTQKTLLRSFKELSNDVLEQQNGPKMSQIFAFQCPSSIYANFVKGQSSICLISTVGLFVSPGLIRNEIQFHLHVQRAVGRNTRRNEGEPRESDRRVDGSGRRGHWRRHRWTLISDERRQIVWRVDRPALDSQRVVTLRHSFRLK